MPERPFIASVAKEMKTKPEIPTQVQYKPGVSLRGLSNPNAVTKTAEKVQETRPQYKPKGLQDAAPKQNLFAKVSGWMSQKLDGLMGSTASSSDSRKANLLVFAVALIMLLLLLVLAKPRRDY